MVTQPERQTKSPEGHIGFPSGISSFASSLVLHGDCAYSDAQSQTYYCYYYYYYYYYYYC